MRTLFPDKLFQEAEVALSKALEQHLSPDLRARLTKALADIVYCQRIRSSATKH